MTMNEIWESKGSTLIHKESGRVAGEVLAVRAKYGTDLQVMFVNGVIMDVNPTVAEWYEVAE